MKKIILPTLSLLFAITSSAQDTTKIYFDKAWKETTADKADYERKKFATANGWGAIDYYHSGKVQMTGTYANDSCTIQNGLFTYYTEKGVVLRTCEYKNGKAEGREELFYESGKKRAEGTYKDGKMDGDWIGYFENGKMAAKASYTANQQNSGNFFNADGSANKEIKVFYRSPEFPGGVAGIYKYVSQSIVYPKSAIKKGIQGTVYIHFTVRKDGVVTNVSVFRGIDAAVDAEAMRVIKAMPAWTPAINGGQLCDYYLSQPVTFKFDN